MACRFFLFELPCQVIVKGLRNGPKGREGFNADSVPDETF